MLLPRSPSQLPLLVSVQFNEVHDMIGIDGLFEAYMHSVIIGRRES